MKKVNLTCDDILAIRKEAEKERAKGQPWGVFCGLERRIDEKIRNRSIKRRAKELRSGG